QSPTRSAGTMYAARTLVYEDCRRDVEIELGPEIIEALGPPLSLLLESARWYTFEAAARYRKSFQQLYTRLAQQIGSPIVDMVSFWREIQLSLSRNTELVDDLGPLFQERWADVLRIPAGQRKVEYT